MKIDLPIISAYLLNSAKNPITHKKHANKIKIEKSISSLLICLIMVFKLRTVGQYMT